MTARRLGIAGFAVLVALGARGSAARAFCTTDVVCAQHCRDVNCGDLDPAGTPRAAYSQCVDACASQTFVPGNFPPDLNCASWVTCMRACAVVRDASLSRCQTARQFCIRTNCRVCAGAATSARIFSIPCVDRCRATRATCRAAFNATSARFRHCRARCQSRCGRFRAQFPTALATCLDACGDAPGNSCNDDFTTCRNACEVP